MRTDLFLPIILAFANKQVPPVDFAVIDILIAPIPIAHLIVVQGHDAGVGSFLLSGRKRLVQCQNTLRSLARHFRSGGSLVGLDEVQQGLPQVSDSRPEYEQPFQQQN